MQPHPDFERARELVLEHGWNSTCYQILNPGIRYWFSARHPAVAGYAEHAGVLVVAGAPVSPEADLPEVTAELERDAARRGLRVCYFGAEARLEKVLRGSPRHSRVLLGAQPVWEPASWAGIVKRHASLRAQLNRSRNKGVTVAERPASEARHLRIEECLQQWLGGRGLPSLHFLIEPNTLDVLADRRVFVAEQGGRAIGFLVASPIPGRHGWLVEQIVRGKGAPNGTTELMIDAALRTLAAAGFAYATLGLAPLSRRSPYRLEDNPAWLRALFSLAYAHGRRFYNFDGLDAFKAKLEPDRWEAVFALANRPRFSPRMLWAIAAAFSGGSPVLLMLRALRRRLLSGSPSPRSGEGAGG
ncbi:MAG: phosphatidylglycerol lysyltransferase domain-containing protein [Thermoanaerobaculia bacterium]